MVNPWQPPESERLVGPPTRPTYDPHPAYATPADPYGRPTWHGPPAVPARRRPGLVVFAVASVVVLVAAVIVLAVVFAASKLSNSAGGSGGSGGSDRRTAKIYAPSGTAFSITLPQGFRVSGDSDLRGGYLAADADSSDSTFLDIYASRAPRSPKPDLVGLAIATQDENRQHGAKVTAAISTVTVNGLPVVEWQESYPETDSDDAYSQLNAIVYVGAKRDHLYLAYSDAPDGYSAREGRRVVAAVVTSLPKPAG